MTLGNLFNAEISQILDLKLSFCSKVHLILLKYLAKVSYALGRLWPRSVRTSSHRVYEESLNLFIKSISERHVMENAVIIPAFVRNAREVEQLERAVLSVKNQVHLVLIIDDASPVCINSINDTGNSYIYKLNENLGPAAARNIGLEICRKLDIDHILFLDADCVVDRNWGSFMLNRLQQGAIAVGGITKALGLDYVSLYHDFFGTLNGRLFLNSEDKLLYNPTCNFGINLKCRIKFDERFPDSAFEDIDFCVKLIKAGYRISFEPRALVLHDYHTNWIGFCKQFKKYGMSEGILLRNHPEYFEYLLKSKEIPTIKVF